MVPHLIYRHGSGDLAPQVRRESGATERTRDDPVYGRGYSDVAVRRLIDPVVRDAGLDLARALTLRPRRGIRMQLGLG
ncbi:MAG: hypothetical protein ACR2IK_01290 [Chloroflexota bacterium]